MARSTPVKKAWRSLAWLGVMIIALTGVNLYGVLVDGWSWTPKLALDLQGGTQIILAPQLEDGQAVTPEQLEQAVAIIRQRVDAGGVSEPDIRTQGDNNIVVSVAGEPDAATLDRIQSSAKLEFRPVLLTAAAAVSTVGDDTTDPSASPTPVCANHRIRRPGYPVKGSSAPPRSDRSPPYRTHKRPSCTSP